MIRQQSSGAEIGPDPARDKFNLGQQGLGDQNNVLGRMPGNFPGPEPPSTPEHYASNATSSFTSAPTPTTTSKRAWPSVFNARFWIHPSNAYPWSNAIWKSKYTWNAHAVKLGSSIWNASAIASTQSRTSIGHCL